MQEIQIDQTKNRQFICPCGKAYYSYAALFTHIKQKHQGKPPGQIIKPKPQNKRGRPRKKIQTQQKCEKKEVIGQIASNPYLNGSSNIMPKMEFKKEISLFQLSPGSQFKSYKSHESLLPNNHESKFASNCQGQLLMDLSKYLQSEIIQKVPQEELQQYSAYKILKGQSSRYSLVWCFKYFLNFYKEGLKHQAHSQLTFLLVLLLQHIMESTQNEKIQDLPVNTIHSHIIPFFEYLTKCRLNGPAYQIFSNLNTIKALIVFFNWLSRLDENDVEGTTDDVEQQS